MRKYLLVKGKKGRLVGNPFKPKGFVGQRQLYFEKGKVPKKRGDHFEPCLEVVPKHRHLNKALLRGSLEVVEEFFAEDIYEARKKLPAEPASPPKSPKTNNTNNSGADE